MNVEYVDILLIKCLGTNVQNATKNTVLNALSLQWREIIVELGMRIFLFMIIILEWNIKNWQNIHVMFVGKQ